ncbi:MAG: NRDE family protein [Bacteroidota bacterium]
MCTVTFIPASDRVVITSNRDEHVSRKARLTPEAKILNGIKVVFPKDGTAGGTWYAINENGTVVVLLNGAFQNHERTPPYSRSRGLLVLDIISTENAIDFAQEIGLANIEPFTLVVFENYKLWEFRWDGKQKHLLSLDSTRSHIWSSWTLYDKEAQAKRNQYFKRFIAKNDDISARKILEFHQDNHGDLENGFIIDRENGLKTLSITQVVLRKGQCQLNHMDLDSNKGDMVMVSTHSPQISRV